MCNVLNTKPPKSSGLVIHMYKTVISIVLVEDRFSEKFGVGVGANQGSVFSPLLFIISGFSQVVSQGLHDGANVYMQMT